MPKTNLTKNIEAKNSEEVEVKDTSTSKVINSDEIAKLNEELAKRDKEIADLKNMMLAFMASQSKNNDDSEEEDGYVYINNNSVGPVNFVLDSEGKSAYYIEAGIQGLSLIHI